MTTTPKSILALDLGGKRVGVAVASLAARLPGPLTTLQQGPQLMAELERMVDEESVATIVVGLPRGLDGQDTGQTAEARAFADQLKASLNLPVIFQDEAVTSKQAEAELTARGKTYKKEDIDALAATYILQDYLDSQQRQTA